MGRVLDTLELVKFSHTLFALPFATAAALAAAGGLPSRTICIGILLGMVGARTAAMAFNRFADADLDRLNTRTASRAVPRGQLSRGSMGWAAAAASLAFVAIAFLLTLFLRKTSR